MTKYMTHFEWTIRKYIGKLFIYVGLSENPKDTTEELKSDR